jgi:hypothetical protein
MANRKSESASNVPNIMLSLSPRGLRPPAAALYIGGTAGLIEQLWRDGFLPYRLVGGVRVGLVEDLDAYLDSLERKLDGCANLSPLPKREETPCEISSANLRTPQRMCGEKRDKHEP